MVARIKWENMFKALSIVPSTFINSVHSSCLWLLSLSSSVPHTRTLWNIEVLIKIALNLFSERVGLESMKMCLLGHGSQST